MSEAWRISENHNSLGCEQPLCRDVNQSPDAQDVFWPAPGLVSHTGVTGSVGTTCYAHAQNMHMAGLSLHRMTMYMYICKYMYLFGCSGELSIQVAVEMPFDIRTVESPAHKIKMKVRGH